MSFFTIYRQIFSIASIYLHAVPWPVPHFTQSPLFLRDYIRRLNKIGFCLLVLLLLGGFPSSTVQAQEIATVKQDEYRINDHFAIGYQPTNGYLFVQNYEKYDAKYPLCQADYIWTRGRPTLPLERANHESSENIFLDNNESPLYLVDNYIYNDRVILDLDRRVIIDPQAVGLIDVISGTPIPTTSAQEWLESMGVDISTAIEITPEYISEHYEQVDIADNENDYSQCLLLAGGGAVVIGIIFVIILIIVVYILWKKRSSFKRTYAFPFL